jgi:type I restriction enzyme S subunit
MKGWRKARLKDITSKIGSGATPKGGKKAYKSSGISLFRSLNVYDGVFKEKNLAFIDDEQASKLSNVIVQEGDVLLNITGASIARCCVAPSKLLPARVNQHVSILRPKPEYVDTYFLAHLLASKEYKDALLTTGEKAGSTRQALTKTQLQNFEVLIPPIAEQKQIVAILDEAFEGIDSAIANTEKNLANARELFESYLNAIFTHKGDDWVDVTLGEIATFRNGLNFTKNSKGESIKIVGVKDFQNNFWIDEEQLETVTVDGDLKEIDVLREGDILTVRSNGNKELIGRCVLAGELSEKTSHSGFTIRIRIERQDIYLPFAVHFLKSRALRRRLIESGDGISISSLNQQKLSLIELSFPPLEKQKSLVTVVDELSDASQRLEAIYQQKLAALNELKQSILQKAFSGELTAEGDDAAVAGAEEVAAA